MYFDFKAVNFTEQNKSELQLTYKETLHYLFKQLPMFQRVGPKAFKKDLKNIKKLVAALDHPHRKFQSIHIAGTNGKGSTAHMIAAILQASGLKVGLYTSPHYRDFRERIKINGKYISKKSVVDFVETTKPYFKATQPSFFEITVAMAFDYFAKQQVDIAVIETGLGGRLDSTNIVRPLLSIITNISFDHTNFLGNTLPKIAKEKAGIIKKNTPVVIGEYQAAPAKVFKAVAIKRNADLTFANKSWKLNLTKETPTSSSFKIIKSPSITKQASSLRGQGMNPSSLKNLVLNASGPYQKNNLITTLEAIRVLNQITELNIKNTSIKNGLKDLMQLTNFKGRWYVESTKPLCIMDSAHNEGGLKINMKRLKELPHQQLHFVLGMVNDKEPGKILSLLPKNAIYYFAKADIPRGLKADLLKVAASKFKLNGKAYSSVKNALKAAKRKATKKDLIYVGGSIFVIAEVI